MRYPILRLFLLGHMLYGLGFAETLLAQGTTRDDEQLRQHVAELETTLADPPPALRNLLLVQMETGLWNRGLPIGVGVATDFDEHVSLGLRLHASAGGFSVYPDFNGQFVEPTVRKVTVRNGYSALLGLNLYSRADHSGFVFGIEGGLVAYRVRSVSSVNSSLALDIANNGSDNFIFLLLTGDELSGEQARQMNTVERFGLRSGYAWTWRNGSRLELVGRAQIQRYGGQTFAFVVARNNNVNEIEQRRLSDQFSGRNWSGGVEVRYLVPLVRV